MPRYFVVYMQEVDIDTQHGVATECKQGNLKVNRPIRGENQVKQMEDSWHWPGCETLNTPAHAAGLRHKAKEAHDGFARE